MHLYFVLQYLGNRTVTFAFSPFSKGEVLSVFFWFFCGRLGVLCLFCGSSLLRVDVSNKFSGVNFWFWVSVSVLCFFDGVLPRFVLYNLGSRSRKCPAKHSLDVRFSVLGSFNTATVLSHLCGSFSPRFERGKCCPFFLFCFSVASSASFVRLCCFSLLGLAVGNKFSGANFCFWVVEVGLVFFDGVLPKFLLQVLAFHSRNCSEKLFLMSCLPFLGSFSLS